jgi:hypothetical protein
MSTINELSVKSTVSDLFDWNESKIAFIISALENPSNNYGRADCSLSARIGGSGTFLMSVLCSEASGLSS